MATEWRKAEGELRQMMRRPCEDAGRDWRDEATSPEAPGAPGSWKRQEGPIRGASRGSTAL